MFLQSSACPVLGFPFVYNVTPDSTLQLTFAELHIMFWDGINGQFPQFKMLLKYFIPFYTIYVRLGFLFKFEPK